MGTVGAVTFVPIDGAEREGYLECDVQACQDTSPVFVMKMGADLPDGWVFSSRFQPGPGLAGHLCPAHAPLERS
jgi:hypothetical protein